MSLQSSCRLALRAALGREHLGKMRQLLIWDGAAATTGVKNSKILFDFMTFRSLYDWSDRQVAKIMPEIEDLEKTMR